MDTIERSAEGVKIQIGPHTEVMPCGLRSFLNRLLIEELTTLTGRMEALRIKWGLKRDIPIYINADCCFFLTAPLRAPDTVCINYFNILSFRAVSATETELIFKNLHRVTLPMTYTRFNQKYEKTRTCLENLS